MKKFKKIAAPLAFALALLFALFVASETLLIKRNDGITTMKAFYDQPEGTVDVLVLGSSHAGMNLSSQLLWDEYGIASYILWGSVQPFWNSYHFLVEALKTQTPKVIVLEMFAATFTFEYSDDARQITNTEGIRLSANKWQAIQVSAPRERWLDLLTLFPVAHARYDELAANDFQYYPWDDLSQSKGSLPIRYSFASLQSISDAAAVSEVKPLHEKEQQYLDMIIALCREKDIPLVLFTAPTVPREGEQPCYNRVAQIAAENGLPYLNCNLLDAQTGFDFTTDVCSDGGHLNTKGANKTTRFLAEYLKANYELPDRRGDEAFASWEANARAQVNQYVHMITGTNDYFAELAGQHYLYYLIKNSAWDASDAYTELQAVFAEFGIGTDVTGGPGGAWTLDMTGGQPVLENAYDGDMISDRTVQGVALHTDFKTGAVTLNGQEVYHLRGPGLILVVYDPYEQRCIDAADFLVKNNFQLQRP